jgi:hypothetical protein
MGLAERYMEWRLRKVFAARDRVLDIFFGRLPDGTSASIIGGTCALYVFPGRGAATPGFRRYPYTGVTTLAEGPELDIVVHRTERLRIADRFSGFEGRMTDFVTRRLLALPSYDLETTVNGSRWRIMFRPWRPDAVGSWVVHRLPGTEPDAALQTELLKAAERDIEATLVGRSVDSDALILPEPETLSERALLDWWALHFGLLDMEDIWWGTKADVSPASMMVFALKGDSVSVVDLDRTRRSHPVVRSFGLHDFRIHEVGRHRFSLELGGRTPHEAFLALSETDVQGHEWVRRVRAAQSQA